MEQYGYIRVSTREQNEARQLAALRQWGIPCTHLLIDKQSGKDFERPAWKRLCRRLHKGDLLVVKSIDRLGRNYQEILEQWRFITKEKGADLLVLDMPLLDTRVRQNGLTGTFIVDLVLQILSYVAQTERENIRQRQAEGIAAAKLRGVRFGPRPAPLPDGFWKGYDAYRAGELSVRKAAELAGMNKSSFYRQCQRLKDSCDHGFSV